MLVRGAKSRKVFLQEILDVLSLTGGEMDDARINLPFRNMKRSASDYLVYILSMTVVTAMMYAFNSLIFQKEIKQFSEMENMMAYMIGLCHGIYCADRGMADQLHGEVHAGEAQQ